MVVQPPVRVGEPRDLFPRHHGRGATWETFLEPDGQTGDYVIFHGNGDCVIVLPITMNGTVLAIHQGRHASLQVMLELPGGALDGKPPEPAAAEEVEEETGYRPERIKLLKRGLSWTEPEACRFGFYSCLAIGCTFEHPPRLKSNEAIELVELPWSAWLAMVEGGEVDDTKAMVTTLLARRHLGPKGELIKP